MSLFYGYNMYRNTAIIYGSGKGNAINDVLDKMKIKELKHLLIIVISVYLLRCTIH